MAGPGKVAVSALACKDCGAPMYPDMAKGGMSCAYCGHFVRFAPTDEDFKKVLEELHLPHGAAVMTVQIVVRLVIRHGNRTMLTINGQTA